MQASISLVLINDNRLLLEGVAALIRHEPGMLVLGAAVDADEALHIVREKRPDIVLLDLNSQFGDSLALAASVRAESPGSRLIVMGLRPTQSDVVALVKAGARGFVMKDASFDAFVGTIRAVATGMQVLPQQLTTPLFEQITGTSSSGWGTASHASHFRNPNHVRLTRREREVVDLISEGLSNKEIATRLQIALHTAKSHVHNVLEKLALQTRLEVAAFTRGVDAGLRPSMHS